MKHERDVSFPSHTPTHTFNPKGQHSQMTSVGKSENLEQSVNFSILKSQPRCKIFRRIPTEGRVCFALLCFAFCLPSRSEKNFQAGQKKRDQRSLSDKLV